MPDAADSLDVRVDGIRAPIEWRDGRNFVFQVPWEVAASDVAREAALVVAIPFSVFDPDPPGKPNVIVTSYSPRFFAPVLAVPGQEMMFSMTGLGPVSPAVETGAVGPTDPPAQVTALLVCEFSDEGRALPVNIVSTALSPAQVGVYGISAIAPDALRASTSPPLTCAIQGQFATTTNVLVVRSAP
jgi:uncharacterized protein (TIGR03437 family)